MRKVLVGCTSVLGIFGVILSSDAMFVKDNRSGIQSQGALVPVSGSVDAPLLLVNDGRSLADGWRALGDIFLESLSNGGTESFERWLRSSENLHPMCQFVAWSLLSCVLNNISSPDDRLRLRDRCGFFKNPGWLVKRMRESRVDGGQYVDGKRFVASVWMNMGGAIFGEVGNSIQSQWPEYMSAYMKTLIKGEELEQEKFETQIVEEKLKQSKLMTQVKEQELRQQKIDFERERMRAEKEDHDEALRVEQIKRLQELQKNQIVIDHEKLKLRDETRKSDWREEHSTFCEVTGFVQPLAQTFVEPLGKVFASKFGEKLPAESK